MMSRFLLMLWLVLGPATGAIAQARLCDAAALQAARDTGVPRSVLLTLTRVETGRSRDGRIEPWPWTLNMGGPGSWHDSAEAALAMASRAVAEGRRNIDLGCFQINYHWHGAQFTGLAQMLDPDVNARYAAEFLRDLHAELGDWTAAAGAFHSRNPIHATRYLARYREIGAAMAGEDPVPASGPTGLSQIARPPLFAPGPAARLAAARPVSGATARPLWETR